MTTPTTVALAPTAALTAPRRLIWITPLTILTSGVANLALYAAAGRLVPAVTAWPGAGPAQIVGSTAVYLLIGALIFALLCRFSAQPARRYQRIAILGLLLSLALPIGAGFGYGAPGAPPAGPATVLTLSLMHVIAFAISVPMFIRLTRV